jgi:hypothetical protein
MIYAIPVLILAYTCDPVLTALFTPERPRAGRYEVCTTPEPIETASQGRAIEALEPLEAFGGSGAYRRSALAQLYGGTRVRVARRWREHDGRFESETLLSPYPDASLTRLRQGTMVIRYILDSPGAAPRPRFDPASPPPDPLRLRSRGPRTPHSASGGRARGAPTSGGFNILCGGAPPPPLLLSAVALPNGSRLHPAGAC